MTVDGRRLSVMCSTQIVSCHDLADGFLHQSLYAVFFYPHQTCWEHMEKIVSLGFVMAFGGLEICQLTVPFLPMVAEDCNEI